MLVICSAICIRSNVLKYCNCKPPVAYMNQVLLKGRLGLKETRQREKNEAKTNFSLIKAPKFTKSLCL